MQNTPLDQPVDPLNQPPTHLDYAVLYAKYIGVCALGILALFMLLHFSVTNFIIGFGLLSLLALGLLVFVFAAIGSVHCIRSYIRSEPQRQRIPVSILHFGIVLLGVSILIGLFFLLSEMNPTGIS